MRTIFYNRFQFLSYFFFSCYLIIVFRLFSLTFFSKLTQQISQPPGLPKKAFSRRIICDTYKIPLAFDQSTYDIYVYPAAANGHFLEISRKLAPVLECQPLALYDFLSRQSNYTPLIFNLHPNKAQRIKAYNVPGIDILVKSSRIYPYKELVANCIGYVNSTNQGLSGIEQSCNFIVQNISSVSNYSIISNLVWLQTSLDIRLQRQFSSILKEGLELVSAKRGLGVVLDCYSGAIKALSIFPQFNPYKYTETPMAILNPWPILELYEPGSTFKPINLAIALESNVINSKTVIVDEGCIKTKSSYFFNATSSQEQFIRSQPNILTLETLVARSSNIGLIHIMSRLSPLVYYKWLKYLNISPLNSFNMNLPYENHVNLPFQREFIKTPETALFFALGHGFSLTPFQLLHIYTSLFNQGKPVQPFLVKKFVLAPNTFLKTSSNLDQQSFHDQNRVFSVRTCGFLLRLLEEVIEYGTAQKGAFSDYRLAGKTGTSVYTLQSKRRLTSFLIAYPSPSPQYICFLLLDLDPRSNQQSSTTAVPLLKALLDILVQISCLSPVLSSK